MAFQCVVVTPEQQAADEKVTQAILPAHDGEIGILTGRAPLLVKLGVGGLRMDLAGGQKRTLFIDGGIAQMKDNKLTVLTTQAVAPEDLDAEVAKSEFSEASAMKITDEQSLEKRDHAIRRARAIQEMAGRAR
jgi:F-type H+-transporting ATPase subunit epsilon